MIVLENVAATVDVKMRSNDWRCAAAVLIDAGTGRPPNRPSRRTRAPGARFLSHRRRHQRVLASRGRRFRVTEGSVWESNPVRASAPK